MKRREEILKRHNYSIWHNEKEDVWYSYLPDQSKAYGRRKIKRKRKRDLEDVICDFYLSDLSDPVAEEPKDLSVESMFYEFMRHKVNEVNSGTIKRMMADWSRFYEPEKEFVSIPVIRLTKINVDDFFNAILEKHSLKKRAFYNMCGILKQTLEYAVDAEYIEKNPYRIKVNKKKFASSSKKPSDKEIFQADEKEIFDTSDLDHIKSMGFHVVSYTKSEDGDRWLPLTEKAKDIIRRIGMVNEEYDYQYKDFLFVRDGRCLTPDAIDTQIKRGCEYIGIPVKTMHKIRKTYASTLLHNGVNLSIVKDMLGHADESTTLKHYIYNIEGSAETDNKVLNALDPQNYAKSDQGDQNIIPFAKIKRAKNLEKSTFSALLTTAEDGT